MVETARVLVDSMKKKNNRKHKKRNASDVEHTLLIACYRDPYSKKSLVKIKKIIKTEDPDNIIILKIIKEPDMPEKIDTRVGMKAREDFLDSVLEDKKEQADGYAKDIIELTKHVDIPTQVHLRKVKIISDEIISEFKDMNVDHLVIHSAEENAFNKWVEGSPEEDIKKKVDRRKITLLD